MVTGTQGSTQSLVFTADEPGSKPSPIPCSSREGARGERGSNFSVGVTYTRARAHPHVHTLADLCTHVHVHTYPCTYVCIHTCTCARPCTCVHTRMHTCIHMHTSSKRPGVWEISIFQTRTGAWPAGRKERGSVETRPTPTFRRAGSQRLLLGHWVGVSPRGSALGKYSLTLTAAYNRTGFFAHRKMSFQERSIRLCHNFMKSLITAKSFIRRESW